MKSSQTTAQATETRQAARDAQAVLDNPAAMRFLCRITEVAGLWLDTHSDEPSRAAYDAGRRRVGLDVVAMLTLADPDAALRMMETARNERQRRENNTTRKSEETENE